MSNNDGPQQYYSPQALSSRLFQLDLQVENLKTIVRIQIEHMHKIDAAVLDLQHQIRQCMTRHEGKSNG